MQQLLYLLPPSEGKHSGGDCEGESLSFGFEKPITIATQAGEKDLKCKGDRYAEGIHLNTTIHAGPWMQAIQRYTGVMYKAIDYNNFDQSQKNRFNTEVVILSGMYGLLKPHDHIGNYKLPISTKGLLEYWGVKVNDALNTLPKMQIIDLLPGSYKKMIDFDTLDHEVIHVDFYQDGKKLTHAVKGVKGRRLHRQIQKKTERYLKGKSKYVDPIKGPIQIIFS